MFAGSFIFICSRLIRTFSPRCNDDKRSLGCTHSRHTQIHAHCSWLNKDNHTVDFFSYFDLTFDLVLFSISISHTDWHILGQILEEKKHYHITYSRFRKYVENEMNFFFSFIRRLRVLAKCVLKMCVYSTETGKVKWNHLIYEAFRRNNINSLTFSSSIKSPLSHTHWCLHTESWPRSY